MHAAFIYIKLLSSSPVFFVNSIGYNSDLDAVYDALGEPLSAMMLLTD